MGAISLETMVARGKGEPDKWNIQEDCQEKIQRGRNQAINPFKIEKKIKINKKPPMSVIR